MVPFGTELDDGSGVARPHHLGEMAGQTEATDVGAGVRPGAPCDLGGGPVQVEERALASYSALRGLTELDPRTHPVVPNLSEPDMERLHRLENEPLTE